MPGRDYGPGGKWIHERAHRLMPETQEQYGAEKGKQVAYATASQQAHKVGKSPKGFRTPEGVRTAKRKHDRPLKEYRKTASLMSEPALQGFFDELHKIAAASTFPLRPSTGTLGSMKGLQTSSKMPGLSSQSQPILKTPAAPKVGDMTKSITPPKVQ